MSICANYIVTTRLPVEALERDNEDVYLNGHYSREVEAKLDDLLRRVGRDRFSLQRFQDVFDPDYHGALGSPRDVLNVLWRNGLLGYQDRDGDIFYWTYTFDDYQLPYGKVEFVLHSALSRTLDLAPEGDPPTDPNIRRKRYAWV